MKPEQRLSTRFAKAIKEARAQGVRIESSHTMPGFPDWLVWPGDGRTVYVELKVHPYRVSAIQRAAHRILTANGLDLYVLTYYPKTGIVNTSPGVDHDSLSEAIAYILKGD